MEVILLQRVPTLGKLGEQVRVKSGYGRNYLIPKGIAVMATADNKAKFEARRAELEAQAAAELAAAEQLADRIAAIGGITLTARAGDEGKLFGSITQSDVVEALAAAGVELDRHVVRMGEAIRQLGEYEVQLHIHHDVNPMLAVTVVAE